MKIVALNLQPDKIPDHAISQIAQAMQIYGGVVAAAHGLVVPTVTFMPGVKVAPAGSIAALFMQTLDVTDALGYHDVDPNGVPYMKNALGPIPKHVLLHDPSGAGESLAGVATHELAELMGDRTANFWAQMPVRDAKSKASFSLLCAELCDPVQGFAFTVKLTDGTLVDCSDFVLPDYFNAALIGKPDRPLSYVAQQTGGKQGAMRAGQCCPGGYQIVAKVSGDGQIFAKQKLPHPDAPPSAWRDSYAGHHGRRSTLRLA